MHWLTVPADPHHAMTVEHGIDCETRPWQIHDAIGVRTVDAFECYAGLLEQYHGLERWFGHAEGNQDGFESDWRVYLMPGTYALLVEDRAGRDGGAGSPGKALRVLT